jgi:3'-5' exoribonuclease|tara:strand:+ start:50231 stop:50845 length:615 start_codon:yes stop_codon:yes gene_type:complete
MKDAKQNITFHLYYLRTLADELGVREMTDDLIGTEKFQLHSGCAHELAHHYGDHGLLQHTREVVEIAMTNRQLLDLDDIDKRLLFLAALFHDAGKQYDYYRITTPKHPFAKEKIVQWKNTEHKRKIHHISRSGILWSKAADKYGVSEEDHDQVLHCILSHHGRRDCGSPVSPKGKMAWLLHLTDSISARMDDADQLDFIVKGNN